jgi:hypothetical protein
MAPEPLSMPAGQRKTRNDLPMTELEIISLVVLSWLLIGLLAYRTALWRGHVWGWYPESPLWGRLAVVLQGPAVVLDACLIDLGKPTEAQRTPYALQLLWTLVKDPTTLSKASLLEAQRAIARKWNEHD